MKKEKDKKSFIAFVMVLLLMVITLAGFNSVSSYAKYVTRDQTGDRIANTAKWGFVLSIDAKDLFSQGVIVNEDDANLSVDASSKNFIVAPGTSGKMSIIINGSAEVLSELFCLLGGEDIYLDITTPNDDGKDTTERYYPINWTVTEKYENKLLGENIKQLQIVDELIATDLGLGVSRHKNIAPNTNINKNYLIEWEWPLFTSDIHDQYDTVLANMAAGEAIEMTTYSGNYELFLNCQISIHQLSSDLVFQD